MLAIAYPVIDPIALQIGPFAIRWYALAYVVGILLGWWYLSFLTRRTGAVSRKDLDDLVVWVTLSVVIGGRLGYVLFYKPGYYLEHPLQILYVWHGGMSFHGGLLGVLAGTLLFAWRRHTNPFIIGDHLVCAVPIGLFLGRIANFINGELYGRVSDVPWAMVFPNGGPLPRHPSQLYEAALEGLVLFAVMAYLALRTRMLSRPGLATGVFLIGYGTARIIGELFRQPDSQLGFLFAGVTMGQLLSLPLLLAGLYLVWRRR